MFVYIEPHNVSRDRFISMRTKQISHCVERVEYSLRFIQKSLNAYDIKIFSNEI